MREGGAPRWRRYVVTRREPESPTVVSLVLSAADGAPLEPFEPGQFLTFRLTDGDGRPTPRNYSLSGDPADRSRYRISVASPDDPAASVGAAHMHLRAAVGDVLEASAPKGAFRLDRTSRHPVVLLADGIGVTPLLAMAHALAAAPARAGTLIHLAHDHERRPFARELEALARRAPNLRIVLGAAASASGSPPAGAAFVGDVGPDLLRAILPIGDYEAYLCGSEAFMQAAYDTLVELGVREERISYEFFGPAKKLARTPIPIATASPPARSEETEGGAIMVAFASSGIVAPWEPARRTLLEFAESRGLTPAFSCRNGICNTCMCEVRGRVRYLEEPLERPPEGFALLCCSAPDGPVTVML